MVLVLSFYLYVGSRDWTQPVPLPTEPSCQPFFFILHYYHYHYYLWWQGWCVMVTVKTSYLEAWAWEGL